jgi:5-methylcytosine-specific restriction endonuclease McrA
MKRTPLKRKTPLKAKVGLKTYKPLRATKSINRVSKKQAVELKERSRLKKELIDEHGEHCMTCNDLNRDFRGISLSHIIPLSRGGKTDKSNCILECYPDHELYEKHPEKRPEWQRIKYNIKGGE